MHRISIVPIILCRNQWRSSTSWSSIIYVAASRKTLIILFFLLINKRELLVYPLHTWTSKTDSYQIYVRTFWNSISLIVNLFWFKITTGIKKYIYIWISINCITHSAVSVAVNKIHNFCADFYGGKRFSDVEEFQASRYSVLETVNFLQFPLPEQKVFDHKIFEEKVRQRLPNIREHSQLVSKLNSRLVLDRET